MLPSDSRWAVLVAVTLSHLPVVRLELEKHITQMDAAAKAHVGEWQECLSKAKHREESMSKELKSLRFVYFLLGIFFFLLEVAK